MKKSDFVIRLIDDDPDLLKSLKFALNARGWMVCAYESPLDFLKRDDFSVPGAAVVDIRMPEMTGIELQEELLRRDIILPLIILTGHADLDVAVRTLKAGACDFLQKPVTGEVLENALEKAIKRFGPLGAGLSSADILMIWNSFSSREKQILKLLAEKMTSRLIAERLGLSERTIEGHRHNIAKKLNAHSAEDQMRIFEVVRDIKSDV